ncbi:MAG: acetate/propionate family kinase [Brevinematales bacterium]|nr:acetate/propionate family kinase [Brevinematales bacterium]
MKVTEINERGVNILVFNCGSSSLKYRLIEMPSEREILSGEAQRIGSKSAQASRVIHRENGREDTIFTDMGDHQSAFEEILRIINRDAGNTIQAIGHRVVHGGDLFTENCIVDANAVEKLKATGEFAPLHNPPAVNLIEACYKNYPELKQVAVFDTAFHSTIPGYASKYALPAKIVKELNIKKYGFHGTSYRYIVREASKMMGIETNELNAVCCHLGSGGASLCAVVNGKSVDNTMGYSPLPGLVMSTRSGDIDPALALKLTSLSDGDFNEMEDLLNKKSGVFGLSGKSSDIRDVINHLKNDSGDIKQRLALQVYLWRIRKSLGAYLAVTGKTDAIVFTDTIGELIPEVRAAACNGMDVFGVEIDQRKNYSLTQLPADISSENSNVRILVIATNEELEIARETARIYRQNEN